MGEHSIRYHLKEGHLSKLVALARDAERSARADSLLDRVEALQAETRAVLEEVKETENYGARLGAIREMRRNLELIGEVTKELDRSPTLNLQFNPEWLQIRAVLVDSLEGHPEARERLLKALEEPRLGNGIP